MRHTHRLQFLIGVAVFALVATSCGDDGDDQPDPTTVPPGTDPTTTITEPEPVDPPDPADSPDPAEPPEDEGPDPVGEFQTGEIATPGFPSMDTPTIQLVDVRVAAHDGFDRVVLEFEGPAPPSWRVTYVDPPVTEDGSGNPIDVAGNAFLELRLTPASGVDLSGPDIVETYTGPNRLDAPGPVAQEVVRTGDFEANLAWVVGVADTAPFAAVFFEDPLRLVVDIAVP